MRYAYTNIATFSARELKEGFQPRHGDQRRGTRPEAGPDRSRRLRDLTQAPLELRATRRRDPRDVSPSPELTEAVEPHVTAARAGLPPAGLPPAEKGEFTIRTYAYEQLLYGTHSEVYLDGELISVRHLRLLP